MLINVVLLPTMVQNSNVKRNSFGVVLGMKIHTARRDNPIMQRKKERKKERKRHLHREVRSLDEGM
jgi:hypothetical protein